LERFELRHKIAKAGLLILIAALAFEVVAAIRTHDISERIIAGLNREIKDTQQREQNLIKETKALRVDNDNLQGSLSKQEGTLKSLGKRNAEFEKAANDQSERNNRIIAKIKADNARVEVARDEMLRGAEKVNHSVAEVQKAETDLAGAVKTIDDLHAQLHDLTTPRVLSDKQLAELIDMLKALPGRSFDLSSNHEAEPLAFAKQIGITLRAANWDWKSKDTLDSMHIEGLPAIGGTVWKGLQLEICGQDNVPDFDRPLFAFINALNLDGFPVSTHLYSDEELKSHNQSCGMIHIAVGSKS
jgi:septal ring factor EnvC (AmiA/AmiB activator)